MAAIKAEYLDETKNELHILMELWVKVRDALQKALGTDPVTKEDEQEFLRVKSDGTKYQRVLKNKLTDAQTRIKKLDFNYEKMLDILRGSISIAHLRSLPESDVHRTLSDWHKISVQLNHVMGAYDFLSSEHAILARVSRGGKRGGKFSLSALKESGKLKWILIVLAVAVAAGVALVAMGVVEL
jgi:hypothetical protein